MSETIENLLSNSGLPGPRGNLELMYSFSKNATKDEVKECMSFYKDNLKNSPEEFVAMCGIVGLCILRKGDIKAILEEIRRYASHSSWRIREAVAMGIQEIAEKRMNEIIENLEEWLDGNDLEKRTIVAALCEPKLLKDKCEIIKVFNILTKLTLEFEINNEKLTENQKCLRKALGYGWSVAVVSYPAMGKDSFEAMTNSKNKNIKWIVKENLKKDRLFIMDKEWVEQIKLKMEVGI